MRPVFFYKTPSSIYAEPGSFQWWLRVWAPVVLAIGIICIESTDTFSAQHTSEWLRPLVERWFGPVSNGQWGVLHHYLRKTGHFVGYGTMGFTFLRAWLYTLGRRGTSALLAWRAESTVLAILSTAIIASGDEFHQSFIPSRTGTPVDVLLDTCGATAFCAVVWLVCWTRRSQPEE